MQKGKWSILCWVCATASYTYLKASVSSPVTSEITRKFIPRAYRQRDSGQELTTAWQPLAFRIPGEDQLQIPPGCLHQFSTQNSHQTKTASSQTRLETVFTHLSSLKGEIFFVCVCAGGVIVLFSNRTSSGARNLFFTVIGCVPVSLESSLEGQGAAPAGAWGWRPTRGYKVMQNKPRVWRNSSSCNFPSTDFYYCQSKGRSLSFLKR